MSDTTHNPIPLSSNTDSELVRLRDAVREHIAKDTIVDLGRVAAQLGRSTRTLQRRLAAHGTSFRDVVQSVRRDLALELLAKGDLTVARVSDAVGYSDPKALRRAFHRWGAGAPSRHRRRPASTDLAPSGESPASAS
ncbi:MAG: helix-turn-helix transcriptional regulator [Myxococcales bacterium]|jgi:AraC-like DNA-binding protein|nr:helix-turn-helix transcriptional regulator [Myxococcales bacterium]